MSLPPYGRLLAGSEKDVARSYAVWENQPVDADLMERPEAYARRRTTTIARPVSVSGPGTFFRREQRTLFLEPAAGPGWSFDRTDLPGFLPISVTVKNVWTTKGSNIVLCSGSPRNYMRMVEHMIALRLGLGLDNLLIRLASGDPPLFDRGSLDLVEAVERAGIVETETPATYVTVREPVAAAGRHGSFLLLLPAEDGEPRLTVDCAVDFKSAIGRQRVRFHVNRDHFRQAARARTNTGLGKVVYCKTVGMLFADVRNLGYTTRNILIAGRRRYLNRPEMIVAGGKSLEAVWHRAALDLLAALSLIDAGRFAGTVISYKSGHTLDVLTVRLLYRHGLLRRLPVRPPGD